MGESFDLGAGDAGPIPCEICRHLRREEGGSALESEEANLLPPEAERLLPLSFPGQNWLGALEKCPLCGCYYRFIHFYEYAPSGNEEECRLKRLDLHQALQILIEGEAWAELMDLAARGQARMVLRAINHSKLPRKSPNFQKLQAFCRKQTPRSAP